MESYGDLSFEPRYNIAPSQSVPVIVRNEDRRDGKRKMPMWIQLKKREPFAFAGLWDCWQDRDSEIELYTFTIITTRPNALLRPIHDRMPVIYDAGMGRQWLDPRCTVSTSKTLAPILQPLPSDLMEAYVVSTLVNSPENDSPACIQPLSSGQSSKRQLPLL